MTLFIADVSDFQGKVDWAAYKASGRVGAICKVSEGTSFVAGTFQRNRDGMDGLVLRGLYHFGRQANDPEADARHFCDKVGSLRSGEVPILDAENTQDSQGRDVIGPDAPWCLAWARVVTQRLGAKPALYFSESYFGDRLRSDARLSSSYRFFWVAAYRKSQPPTIPGMRLWQSTNGTVGRVRDVPGVPTGRCDDNEFEGSAAELAALAGVSAALDPPKKDTHKEADGMRLIGVGKRGIFLVGASLDSNTGKVIARQVDSPERVTELVRTGVVSDFNSKENLSEASFDQFFVVV